MREAQAITVSMSLEELKAASKEMEYINERQEKRVSDLESKVYQLASFYLVFQGVVVTAISQSSSFKCHHLWIPVSLSLLAALINGFAFFHTIRKYLHTKRELDRNRLEHESMKRLINNGRQNHGFVKETLRPDPVKWRMRYVYVGITMLALIAFTIMMSVACRAVLCDGEEK